MNQMVNKLKNQMNQIIIIWPTPPLSQAGKASELLFRLLFLHLCIGSSIKKNPSFSPFVGISAVGGLVSVISIVEICVGFFACKRRKKKRTMWRYVQEENGDECSGDHR
jgi:hypothetical protein